MANRLHYWDAGLMFARETDSTGSPLQIKTIGEREVNKPAVIAGVKRIKFHGIRHTTAILRRLSRRSA